MSAFVFGGILAIAAGALTLSFKFTTNYQILEPVMPSIAAIVGGGLALLLGLRAG